MKTTHYTKLKCARIGYRKAAVVMAKNVNLPMEKKN